MLLSHKDLVKLVTQGVINANPENINGASIDITMGDTLLLEDFGKGDINTREIDLQAKETINTREIKIPPEGFRLHPNDFVLAMSQETFNLPTNIACEYKLKSSLARNGLNHLLAGWADPGWNGSKLTLELHNVLSKHVLLLKAGMKIGQMVFWKCEPVPEEESYATKGQYNNDQTVTASKGVR